MKKEDLEIKFKRETGINAIKESTIKLEESEFIPDHYLITKTDMDDILILDDEFKHTLKQYKPKYIEWLEEHFKD